jgi:2-polyprenyl-3-methyl-5-hydroxy-6-metoxy-1,4-benzoquinol methylase
LLIARHPILSTSQYNALYEQANSKVWSSSNAALRYDQVAVKNIILDRNKSDIRVLDVGCYTAELLSSLPENYLKYGIEMSQEAASVASIKGIKILGNDLYNIDTIEKFDLILAVDVIEHTHNPEHFIEKLSSLLLPNGEIVISTGNTDNWLWRLLKNRFWYCKFPEHISFIGEKWLDLFCKKNNFIVVDVQYFSYVPTKPLTLIKNLTKLFLSLIHIYPERLSNTTKDHFCFVIRKIS